jgi:muramoyltetrapeptide carboxypeptidase
MSLNRVNPEKFIPLKPLPAKGTIGVFAPSSPVDEEKLNRGVNYLESLGYRVKLAPGCLARHHYLAGSGKERAADLMDLLLDRSVNAVFCTRGGFGSIMMLPWLDYPEIRSARKLILGFSDVTALQWAIYAKTGLPSVSAGMVGTDLAADPKNAQFEEHFWKLLHSGGLDLKLSYTGSSSSEIKGTLMPGTMSVGAMLLGSEYFPGFRGCIPVLEDVDEPRHKVEAYMQQFLLGGHFRDAKAVILGNFSPAEKEQYPEVPDLDTVIDRTFSNTGKPLVRNFSYGHIPGKISLPAGVPVSLSLGPEPSLKTLQPIFES